MADATRIARASKGNGAARRPVCARPRRCSRNASEGSSRTVGKKRWKCARKHTRVEPKQPEGKATVYRRSTSRKVLGVMPMCRVNTAVKWLCVNPSVLATSPIGNLGSCNKVRA